MRPGTLLGAASLLRLRVPGAGCRGVKAPGTRPIFGIVLKRRSQRSLSGGAASHCVSHGTGLS